MPRKPAHLARKTFLATYVTKAEREAIDRLARMNEKTVSTTVRDMLRLALRSEAINPAPRRSMA